MTAPDTNNYRLARERILAVAQSGARGLDLTGLGLTAVPPEIGQCRTLWKLFLQDNRLTVLPPELSQCGELQKLNLSHNAFAALPPEITGLASLEWLWLGHNEMTRLPRSIGSLQHLEKLDLSHNHLTGLPPELLELKKLRELFLHGNDALGLPSSLTGPTAEDCAHDPSKAVDPRAILEHWLRRPPPKSEARDAESSLARPLSLFVSYARKNRAQLDKLSDQLEWLDQHGYVQPWDDSQLIAGEEFDAVIRARLGQAELILLLISAEFLASKYIRRVEIPIALERAAAGTARIVWIRLDGTRLSTDDEQERRIRALQCATAGSKPIARYNPRTDGWIEVREAIEKAVEDFRRQAGAQEGDS